MDYDEKTCVTAGELRAVGISVPDLIPGCAWIPRWSMRLKLDGPCGCDGQGCATFGVRVEFAEPFRWVEGTFTVPSEQDRG